jgi:hypothetical protein
MATANGKWVIKVVKAMHRPEQDGEVFAGWRFESKANAERHLDFYNYHFPNLTLRVEYEARRADCVV